jgi:ribosomal protein L16 Arg81 hydroxylase
MSADTTQAELGFSFLIAPTRAEDFFAEHWENKPLALRRDEHGFYDRVLSSGDLEEIISTHDLRYPAIQLARHGGYFPPEAYTKNLRHGSEVFTGVPDIDKIRAEYRSGSTIVLPALQRIWPPLRDLCAALESTFSHPVHANAYLTPGNAVGFSPHYDTHEVFVLQIGGHKRWQIREPPIVLPHRSQPFTRASYTPPAPILELDLRPGDLLYLPRGYVHSAVTSDSYSAHVTIGVTVYTWVELLSELIHSSSGSMAFRKALPVGFLDREGSRRALESGMRERLAELVKNADYEGLLESFTHRVRSSRPGPHARFRAKVSVIGLHTIVRPREPGRYEIQSAKGGTVLSFDGRRLVLPSGVGPTLEALCARASFQTAELPAHLEQEATLAFVQYLAEEGFLTIVAG